MFFQCQRREGWFFNRPPACFSIYGNVYPPHWSIGREGGDSGFRRSRIWILVSRNKVAPLPPALLPPPPPFLCPLFWRLRRECLSAVPLWPPDHLLALRLRVCEREWEPAEGQLPVGPDLTWVHHCCQSEWHFCSQTPGLQHWQLAPLPDDETCCWECFNLGYGQLLSQESTPDSGI